mmetsp:Transcript_23265/g.59804  ORF Transcript_23265/g.59804 Transcript_23265/m.59804 type:complete len:142 (-) Transcript_23265:726-1151(-)
MPNVQETEAMLALDTVATREPGGRRRVGEMCGSLEMGMALELKKAAQEQEEADADARAAKQADKAARKAQASSEAAAKLAAHEERARAFLACTAARQAGVLPCACGAASAGACENASLHFCTSCRNVQKNKCTKKKCQQSA